MYFCKHANISFLSNRNMTIQKLRIKYIKDLAFIYPQSEIESIFSILVQHQLSLDKASMILAYSKELTTSDSSWFIEALNRLNKKEPVQYIIASCSFYNLTFKVNPSVLIPRSETEELVDWILKDMQEKKPDKKITILDIGTGSGCIAISLAKHISNAEIWALDISKKALTIAKENTDTNKVSIKFLQQDILKNPHLPQKFDLIVSNPPYVRDLEKELIHENVKEFEPSTALFVTDENPLVFYDKIAELSLNYLNPKGSLYFEINQYLAKETKELMQKKGFKELQFRKDLLGNDRMLRLRK